jgi:adenosylhomocysteine nucleosidase
MILVLTPLSFENEALRAGLGAPSAVNEHHGVRVHRFGEGLACATGGHGKVQFALASQMLIRELKPALLVCAGACGALDPALKVLDVVAATETVEHDFNLRFEKRPHPRFKGDEAALAKLGGIRKGVIASGDEDIVDAVRRGVLREATGACAVAWEGAGGARAAAFCATPYLELRVVTDSADAGAPGDFKANLRAGMAKIAAVLQSELIRN